MDLTQIDLLSLLARDTKLNRRASTDGGEYAGPCPFCGGTDRFRVWPSPAQGNPRAWCRQCGFNGDAVTYLMQRDHLNFAAACRQLGVALDQKPIRFVRTRPRPAAPRSYVSQIQNWTALCSSDWQQAAARFVTLAWKYLWDYPSGGLSVGRSYLHKRGFHDGTLAGFEIGYSPHPIRAQWGEAAVWLPSGIVIPHEFESRLWAINVRRLDEGTPKYVKAKGSANGLFVAGAILPSTAVILVEGELDALSIWQQTRGLDVAAVATSSVTGGFLHRWIAWLSGARRIGLAFDADEAGESAVARWRTAFPEAVRLQPTRKDVNEMLCAGDDIALWLKDSGLF